MEPVSLCSVVHPRAVMWLNGGIESPQRARWVSSPLALVVAVTKGEPGRFCGRQGPNGQDMAWVRTAPHNQSLQRTWLSRVSLVAGLGCESFRLLLGAWFQPPRR